MSLKINKYLLGTAFAAGLLVGLPFQCGFAQSYNVVDLGTPGGSTNLGSYSAAHGINSSGSVAGEWAQDAFSQRAFLFTNGTNSDLGMITGVGATIAAAAYGINASNLVVGETSGGFNTRAFLYTNGAMVDLTTFSSGGFTYSIAHAINAADKIVGESFISSVANSDIHAVIFLGNKQQTDLGTLTNGTYSSAYGINNSNVIVGESTVSSGNVYAFIYSNATMTSLGSLPGGTYSAAFAINDAGQIAGEAADSNGETHAFLRKNGTLTDLGTLGGTASSAAAINSAGTVVGYALTTDGNQHAFLYDGTTILDLNNLISSAVCTNLVSADGINDAGQITGSGYTTKGIYHAFLLTPAVTLTASPGLTNGKFMLTVQGAPGQHFAIQASTNFVNWTSLNTNTLVSASTNWLDADVPTNNYRFYRAVMLP
jgi:probable HAF family extracellular repeat protein